MKKLLIAFLLLMFAMPCFAGQVTLQWDPNDPAPTGYTIYMRTDSQQYDYSSPVYDGNATTATITIPDGVILYFVARAYLTGPDGKKSFSGDSNEVGCASRPAPPSNLNVVGITH